MNPFIIPIITLIDSDKLSHNYFNLDLFSEFLIFQSEFSCWICSY